MSFIVDDASELPAAQTSVTSLFLFLALCIVGTDPEIFFYTIRYFGLPWSYVDKLNTYNNFK